MAEKPTPQPEQPTAQVEGAGKFRGSPHLIHRQFRSYAFGKRNGDGSTRFHWQRNRINPSCLARRGCCHRQPYTVRRPWAPWENMEPMGRLKGRQEGQTGMLKCGLRPPGSMARRGRRAWSIGPGAQSPPRKLHR